MLPKSIVMGLYLKPPMDDNKTKIIAELSPSISAIDAQQWDACNSGDNPFTSHAFLAALEQSNSVGQSNDDSAQPWSTGWVASPIILKQGEEMVGAIPAYLKSHSKGEYIFDHMWADAYQRAGGRYYPKLQIAAPFSPVPGERLLLRDPKYAAPLLQAAESIAKSNALSSVHATFVDAQQIDIFEEAHWLVRKDSQFHWYNRGYSDFDDFLGRLSSRKRKNIRKERRNANAQVTFQILRGNDIKAHHWDIFWEFYLDTSARKWGSPYLTRSFFDIISNTMGDKLLLFLAMQEDIAIAGALNFIGPNCLYGRYWGAKRDIEFLHFETCYYRAIEWAIEHKLDRVEAGAQGPHKLARGYEPTPTYSAHYIVDPAFREAIDDYLKRERIAVAQDIEFMAAMGPFKRSS